MTTPPPPPPPSQPPPPNQVQPPGWYPAPDAPGSIRYWDGLLWTDNYAAPANTLADAPSKKPPPSARFNGLPGLLKAAVIIPCCLAIIVGLVFVGPMVRDEVSDWWDEVTEPLEDKMRWSRQTCGPDEAKGTVRNTSDETVNVFMEVKFLNGPRLVDTRLASVRSLSPGQLGEWSTFSPSEPWNNCTVSVKSAYES